MNKSRFTQENSPLYGRVLLLFLFAINLLNYIDRLVISGLLEPIRKDLGLTDSQLGQIALAFLLPYSILPPVVGWVGDRAKRTKLIAFATSIWSLATAFAGVTRSFGQLVSTRSVVGVGETTYMTVAPSLIADLVEEGKRGAAMSLFYIASPIGAALGVILGGLIAASYGWRVACFMVGVPGIAMAILMLFVAEPRRGSLDPEQQADRPSLKVAVRELLHNRAFLLLVIAYTVQIFSYNPIEFWVPTILQRDKGMMLVQASATYGTIVFLGGLLGPLIGGFLGDALAKRRSLAYYWICSGSALACTVPLLAIATLHRGTPLFSAIFAEVFLGNISTGLVFAILVGIVIPGLRGTATAVILTVMHILGDGISQPLIGRVSAELAMGSPVTRPLEWLGTALHIPAPDHHLSLALIAITIPATLLASVLYLVAAYKGTSR